MENELMPFIFGINESFKPSPLGVKAFGMTTCGVIEVTSIALVSKEEQPYISKPVSFTS
jgi:succinate-acetate transporter protein